MTPVNENIEQLIVRHLDGDLTEEETHQLNCELVRDPQARRMLEAYEKVDVLAAAAFEDAVDSDVDHEVIFAQLMSHRISPTVFRSRHHMWLWFIPGAVAAALLAMVIPFPSMNTPVEPIKFQTSPLPIGQSRHRAFSPTRRVGHGQMQPGDWSRPKISRDRGKEVIGVRDEQGNLYWIEVDRTWLVKQPGRPLGEL